MLDFSATGVAGTSSGVSGGGGGGGKRPKTSGAGSVAASASAVLEAAGDDGATESSTDGFPLERVWVSAEGAWFGRWSDATEEVRQYLAVRT